MSGFVRHARQLIATLIILSYLFVDIGIFKLLLDLGFFFIRVVVDVLLVLDIKLASLQVYVVDVKVVLVKLHMDHLLPSLVQFILLQAFVDLVDLISHF